MSWKAVEMQIALPRTQDAGKLQEQMQQRGQLVQDTLAKSQIKTTEEKRKQVNDFDQKGNVGINDNHDGLQQSNEKKVSEENSEQQDANHPYLGQRVDYSG